jgi:WD40 repeat protein
VALSPDGQFLAVGDGDPDYWSVGVKLLRLADQEFVARYRLFGERGRVVFSPDGTLLAATAGYGTFFWDTAKWKEVQMPDIPAWRAEEIEALAFSPDGRWVAVAGRGLDLSQKRMGAQTGKPFLLGLSPREGHAIVVIEDENLKGRSVAFSGDGEFLASPCEDFTICLWSVKGGKLATKVGRHEADVKGVVFSPDGKFMASWSEDAAVKLWRWPRSQLVRVLSPQQGDVESVAFTPDGKLLAIGAGRHVQLWDVRTGEQVRTFEAAGQVLQIAFAKEKNLLAILGKQALQLWAYDTGKLLTSVEVKDHPPGDWGDCMAFSEDETALLVAERPYDEWGDRKELKEGEITLFSTSNGTVIGKVRAREKPSWGEFRFWDITCQQKLAPSVPPFSGMNLGGKDPELSVVSPDGKYLARSDQRWETVEILLGGTQKLIHRLNAAVFIHRDEEGNIEYLFGSPGGHNGARGREDDDSMAKRADLRIHGLAFSPNSQFFAAWTGGDGELGTEGFVQVWRTSDWKLVNTIKTDCVLSFAFSPDGRVFAALRSEDESEIIKSLRFYRVEDGTLLMELGETESNDKEEGEVVGFAISPDWTYLALARDSGTLSVWRLPKLE